ncbi:MAG: alpha/beta fold hydrolase [Bacteroidia bacterium]|nr:alpha/beta fold hydrolase [Bacteroidia bacterium]
MHAGFQNIEIRDEELELSFPLKIFYPSKAKSQIQQFGPYQMEICVGGEIAGENLPLVIISHGSGGAGLVYRDLAMHLAKAGFVVALPQHPFNNRFDNSWEGDIRNLIHRPRHIKMTADTLYAKDDLRDKLKEDSIALIGHSMGGYTALAVAGGKPNTGHMIEFCKQPENIQSPMAQSILKHDPVAQDISVEKDDRVKAVVLMAAASIEFKSSSALEEVDAQVLMYTPTLDESAVKQAEIVETNLKKELLTHKVIEKGDHYSFLSPFPERIRPHVGPAGRDAPGFDRSAFHAKMHAELEAFFKEHL